MSAIYRSPVLRWTLILTGVLIGLIFLFADPVKWQSAPSLQWLRQSHIPFAAWGAGFLLYSTLLLAKPTRPAGFALGSALFAVFAVSLFATINTAGPKSAVGLAAVVDVVVFHAFAVKTSLAALEVERTERL